VTGEQMLITMTLRFIFFLILEFPICVRIVWRYQNQNP